MTVCIAAIYGSQNIIGASDRMLTAGDIQFQPEQSKLYRLTSSIVAMVAGDISLQVEITARLRTKIRGRLELDSSHWLEVSQIAKDYSDIHSEIARERAERDLLAPLGLTSGSFVERQGSMRSEMVKQLTSELINYRLPDTAVVIAGIDGNGAHIWAGYDGSLTCEDAVGFAAVGAGHWHAKSQFMFARYTRGASAAKALYLVYAAKKRAETAPGVGVETDMFLIGPEPGTYSEMRTVVIDSVATIYQDNIRESERIYAETERKVNEYIATLAEPEPEPQQSGSSSADAGSAASGDAVQNDGRAASAAGNAPK
jgi:20S proteasome alpha/beta subunit